MLTTALAGFALGLSLIVAIGAQNAFVLRQGLRREHVFAVVLICAISDALLIVLGVGGFSIMSAKAPWIEPVFTYGGAAFLFWYGARSFRSAWTGAGALVAGDGNRVSLKSAVLTCLALTWLNPHVYLDTVVLLGAVSSEYDNKIAFGSGAVFASFSFFFTLGFGARYVSPFFATPRSWQYLDAAVGIVMWAIAISLLMR